MAYNDFTVEDLSTRLGLQITEVRDLFATVTEVPIGATLTEYLRENAPLALAMSTEKARSEMIIAPILLEVRRQRAGEVSLFSGMEFPVDPSRGLNGYCDYLFSLTPTQIAIEAPVVSVVEAKNENIRQGVPQCVAEMFAAKIFNERRGREIPVVFGAVTTGSDWRFLRLSGTRVEIDMTMYYLRDVERIVGVFLHMVSGEEPRAATA